MEFGEDNYKIVKSIIHAGSKTVDYQPETKVRNSSLIPIMSYKFTYFSAALEFIQVFS